MERSGDSAQGCAFTAEGALPSLFVVPWMPACLGKPAEGGHTTMCQSEKWEPGSW